MHKFFSEVCFYTYDSLIFPPKYVSSIVLEICKQTKIKKTKNKNKKNTSQKHIVYFFHQSFILFHENISNYFSSHQSKMCVPMKKKWNVAWGRDMRRLKRNFDGRDIFLVIKHGPRPVLSGWDVYYAMRDDLPVVLLGRHMLR